MIDRPYEVLYSESAAAARDALAPDRRDALEKAVAILARDPYTRHSRPIAGDGQDREVRLTSRILAEYMVSRGRLVLVVLRVFDDEDVLLPE